VFHDLIDHRCCRHRIRAGQLRSYVRSRTIREATDALKVPPRQQTMHERPSESVTGTKAAQHIYVEGINAHSVTVVGNEHTAAAEFHNGQSNATLEQIVDDRVRFNETDSHLTFGSIAHHHAALRDRALGCSSGFVYR
jgi:hypothetical protein